LPGLSLTEADTVFIHQSCNICELPFDLRPSRPNKESLLAIAEAKIISRDLYVKEYHVKIAFMQCQHQYGGFYCGFDTKLYQSPRKNRRIHYKDNAIARK